MGGLRSLEREVEQSLADCRLLAARLVLALSGGIDSMVLLDVLAQIAARHRFTLRCLHVDHGISRHAREWAAFCARRCADYGAACTIVETKVKREAGQSLEAAAREARYGIFRIQDADAIVLAHQLDDQAETLLLQLLRGAGVAGLAAMAPLRAPGAGGPRLFRPLLDCSRQRILAYAQARALSWVEDDSNACENFDRNFLRRELLPRLSRRFPAWRETVARSARNLAEAQTLLDALARQDAADILHGRALSVEGLRRLPEARMRNLLRWYVAQHGERMPSRRHLQSGIDQLLTARRDRQPRLALERGGLSRHGAFIEYVPQAPQAPPGWSVRWSGEEMLALPHALGILHLRPAHGAGLRRDTLLVGGHVRLRAGGERMQLHPSRPVRALKDLLREAGVAPWRRQRMPLLFCGDALCWAPGLGCDWRFAAAAGEDGVLPDWEPVPVAST